MLLIQQTHIVHVLFEHTCAYARWAHMHHFLSVCDWTKIHGSIIHHWTKFVSQEVVQVV